ncbi:MAG: hypothetical protein AAGC60_14145 [Acidobacteriota bacterium]
MFRERAQRRPHRPFTSPADIARVCTQRALVAIALLGAVCAVPAASADESDTPHRDARAVEIAERSRDAMGGAALEATRFLRFNFFGARTHHWDRSTGRHRLEGTSRDGQSYVVVQDLDDRTGHVWIDGEAADEATTAEWLERAHGAWINDTYWLLMPAKLLDPGVHLVAEGREEIDGKSYDKVKLTFDQVGLTPGDTYWAWFDTETGLMHQWAYHLQSWEAEREPTRWLWLDWQPYGDVVLSSVRRMVDDGSERMLSDIAVFEHLDDALFTDPAPASE